MLLRRSSHVFLVRALERWWHPHHLLLHRLVVLTHVISEVVHATTFALHPHLLTVEVSVLIWLRASLMVAEILLTAGTS